VGKFLTGAIILIAIVAGYVGFEIGWQAIEVSIT
jgi:hypothetical protein